MVRSLSTRIWLLVTALFVASPLSLPRSAAAENPEANPATARPLVQTRDDGAGAAEHVIVVLGSSTAAGIGPAAGELGWVDRYRAHLQRTFPSFGVINLAAGGFSTFHIQPSDFVAPDDRPRPDADRNITRALSYQPDAIIINMPSNDQQSGHALDEQMANYERVVALAAAHGASVWVTTSQPRNFPGAAQRTALISARDAITARFGDHSIDFWSPFGRGDGTIDPGFDSGDGVHLNGAAHEILAQRAIDARIAERVLAASP